MPVRIYEIARQVGLTSKDVLVKAKELGIEAKVASSSIDKISAEYLVGKLKPEPPAEEKVEEPAAPVEPAPIVIVKEEKKEEEPPAESEEPEAEEEAPAEVETSEETSPEPEPEKESAPEAEPEPVVEETAEEPVAEETAPETKEEEAAAETSEESAEEATPEAPAAEPAPAPEPEEPAGPKVGDLIGRIQLPKGPVRSARPNRKEKKEKAAKKDGRRSDGGGGGSKFKVYNPPPNAPSIILKTPIVVRDLAEKLNRKPFQIIADLMNMGVFANVNQALEEPVAKSVCAKHGFKFEVEKRGGHKSTTPIINPKKKKIELDADDKPEDLKLRAPIITIMGHVDHGKTTLLDVIRKSRVTAGEAGGITQHIGAYTIEVPHPERPKDLQQLTFLDTPGHAAFSSMRARGATVTDVVVLVVAADDGLKPQTLEAIDHAQAAEVPLVVAVNKCDHPNANPMQVRTQLQDRGLMCEEWGGDIIFQDVSALKNEGIDKLLELLLLQAEMMELKANPNRKAVGNVIESGIDRAGPVATVLVRKGTLKQGDPVICGELYGKAKALIDDSGKRVKEAGPSVAVKVLGLNGVPEAGAEFNVVDEEKEAKSLAEKRTIEAKAVAGEKRSKMTLENFFKTLEDENRKTLKLIVKADTHGSKEAVVDALKDIQSEKVDLNIISSGVGVITGTDIALASASETIVIGFHSKPDKSANDAIKREGVQVKTYEIIYELVDDVRDAMAGLLDPIEKIVSVGSADVHKMFGLTKGGTVAGCIVGNGRVIKGRARVTRRGKELWAGNVLSLRRFQDEVNEVRLGMDCGIRLDGFNEFEEGDVIECFTVEKEKQTL